MRKNKEKHTTYPIGPLSYTRMIDAVREALGTELDIHSAFTWEKFLRKGVDAHFNARISHLDRTVSVAKASDIWKQLTSIHDSDGEFKCPAGEESTAVYSKNTFNHVCVDVRLPQLSITNQSAWIGLEGGPVAGGGISAFSFRRSEVGQDVLLAAVGGNFFMNYLTITDALPSGYKTGRHTYAVNVLKPWTEFYIGNKLCAVMLNSGSLNFPDVSYPPYGIGRARNPFPQKMTTLIEVAGLGQELVFPMAPSLFRAALLPELPPRNFLLYNAGTNDFFAGLTIAAGTETSHPVPVFGYSNKTFHFIADQNGDIDIELISQQTPYGWHIYSPDAGGHTESSYVANQLWSFIMTGDALLARLTFNPDAYPCDVVMAEVQMR